jgi:hypothetical protein
MHCGPCLQICTGKDLLRVRLGLLAHRQSAYRAPTHEVPDNWC